MHQFNVMIVSPLQVYIAFMFLCKCSPLFTLVYTVCTRRDVDTHANSSRLATHVTGKPSTNKRRVLVGDHFEAPPVLMNYLVEKIKMAFDSESCRHFKKVFAATSPSVLVANVKTHASGLSYLRTRGTSSSLKRDVGPALDGQHSLLLISFLHNHHLLLSC